VKASVLIRLTYDLRRGLITGVLASQRLAVLAQPSRGLVQEWEKLQELRTAGWIPTDYIFDLPSKDIASAGAMGSTGIVTRVGRGSTNASAAHRSPSIAIDGTSGSFYIHGWPPCNLASCLVVSRGWEELWRALAREAERSVDFYVAR
jgi:hypothetical protein